MPPKAMPPSLPPAYKNYLGLLPPRNWKVGDLCVYESNTWLVIDVCKPDLTILDLKDNKIKYLNRIHWHNGWEFYPLVVDSGG